jgi:hypothetical protein
MVADGQSAHSQAHGKQILYDCLYGEFLAEAKAAMDPAKKRVLSDSLPDPFLAPGPLPSLAARRTGY